MERYMRDWLAWYEDMSHCVMNTDGYHNFIPYNFVLSQYTNQATGLVCSHCLQLVEMKDVQECNSQLSSLDTSDNV